MAYRSYFRHVALWATLVVLVVTVVNVLMDPYAIFGTMRIPGISSLKPYAGDRGRTTKIYQIQRVMPMAIVTGNSRPEMGLNPRHACWPPSVRPVYNAAIPGISIYRQLRLAEYGLATGSVKVLLIGIDFVDFLERPESEVELRALPLQPIEQSKYPVATEGPISAGFPLEKIKDYLAAALSLDALGDSFVTLFAQRDKGGRTRTPLGFNPADGIYRDIVRYEGVRVLFAQKERELSKSFEVSWTLYPGNTNWSSNFEALVRILRDAHDHGTQAILFINPYHSEYLTLLKIHNLWDLFAEWKTRVTEIASTEGVALWDFSGIHPYTTESIMNVARNGESLKWFWEPSHYRQELGDVMLSNIWRSQCPAAKNVERFGEQLTLGNIAAHLRLSKTKMGVYLRDNPDVVERLQALARQ